jgi:hypothetical protein
MRLQQQSSWRRTQVIRMLTIPATQSIVDVLLRQNAPEAGIAAFYLDVDDDGT